MAGLDRSLQIPLTTEIRTCFQASSAPPQQTIQHKDSSRVRAEERLINIKSDLDIFQRRTRMHGDTFVARAVEPQGRFQNSLGATPGGAGELQTTAIDPMRAMRQV